MTVEYKILSESMSFVLEQTVNRMLKMGWELHGALLTEHRGNSQYFIQAMVKRNERSSGETTEGEASQLHSEWPRLPDQVFEP